MSQSEHPQSIPDPRPIPVSQHGDGRLKKLGFFLLLLHKGRSKRYWEIDALRGVAILMMVTYHAAYDLFLLGYYQTSVVTGSWRLFARATAFLFVFLVGVSLAISYARRGDADRGAHLFKKYLVRGLKLVGWGMVITLVTWVYFGKPVIIFGILHLIGVATILAYSFLRLRWANLPIGVVLIALGMYVNRLPVPDPWFLLLGLRPRWLVQLDYFPLLPWFGVVLLGVFIGQQLYTGGKRQFNMPDGDGQAGFKELVWLGHHSLAVYLIHQPLLMAAINVVSVILQER